MKKLITFVTVALLTIASSSLYAQNYYVCDTGDDNNDGKSELKPFRSYEKAMDTFNSMSGGDSVLFCRGGVFSQTSNKALFNYKCSATSVCTIGDYGSQDDERPYIVATNAYGLNFQDGGNADQDGGYIVSNLILRSTTNNSIGVMMFNDVDDVVLDNLHIEGFEVGVYSAGTNVLNTGANKLHERIVLKNSMIINNKRQGWLGGCNDCLIVNNTFESNGEGVFDHNIYVASQSYTTVNTGMTIRGNTLYKSAMLDGKCGGVPLVAHGLLDDLVIENNLIKEDVGAVSPLCWGISIDPGNNYEEVFHNVVIRNNKLLNVGNVGIGCASCDGATIENNTIIDEGSVLSYGINVPVKTEDTVKSKNIKVRNNTILIGSDRSVTAGIVVGGENAAIVENNTISLPVDAQGKCVEKKDASANIDISTNKCQTHTSISFTDLSTGESTSGTTETIVDIVEVDTSVSTETASTETASTETASTEKRGKKLGQITTTSDIDTALNTDYSTTDYKKCRASANGKCLML